MLRIEIWRIRYFVKSVYYEVQKYKLLTLLVLIEFVPVTTQIVKMAKAAHNYFKQCIRASYMCQEVPII